MIEIVKSLWKKICAFINGDNDDDQDYGERAALKPVYVQSRSGNYGRF